MAKRKAKTKRRTKPKTRTNTMATKTRRRRRRRSTTAVRRTLSAAPRRRRRKRGFADGKTGLIMSVKHNSAGALGGGLLLLTRLFAMPLWARSIAGYAGAVGLSMANAPFVGAGLAGATTYNLGTSLFSTFLNDDGDLEEAEYVDPSTLEDTGYIDQNGNAIVMDEDGVMMSLNDNGDLEAIGDAYSLQEGTDIQGVSMLPLQDPYDLQQNNAYALAANY